MKYQYNDDKDMKSLYEYPVVIISFIDDQSPNANLKILRHRQMLHISRWSLKHRILAIQMFDENRSEFGKFEGRLEEQCLKIRGETTHSNTYGFDQGLLLVDL
jgi:hypothetical protein